MTHFKKTANQGICNLKFKVIYRLRKKFLKYFYNFLNIILKYSINTLHAKMRIKVYTAAYCRLIKNLNT